MGVASVPVAPVWAVTVRFALVSRDEASTPSAGTLAASLLWARETTPPPLGAGPFRVTVPVGEEVAPVTLAGLRLREEGTGGTTVSAAVCVPLRPAAEMVTAVDVATALVITVKVAQVAPA